MSDRFPIPGSGGVLLGKGLSLRHSEEPLGMLCIWEGPQFDGVYTVGVDTADGVGADRTCVQVLRTGNRDRPDEQVAEWVANASQLESAPYVFHIAKLYSPSEECLVSVESNRGDTLQHELRMKYGWTNLYRQKYMDRVKQMYAQRIGWYTDASSRPKLLGRGVQWVKDGKLRINSQWCVSELADFEYAAETQKMKAAANRHDDRVMALFISLYSSRDWAAYEEQVITVAQEASKPKPPANYQMTDASVDEAEGRDFQSHGLYY